MGKSVFSAKRKDMFAFQPEDLVLITDKKDPLYDPRVELEPESWLIDSILFNGQGVIEPVVIFKDSQDRPVVIDGRQRVKAAIKANELLKARGELPLKVHCVVRRGSEKDHAGVSVTANEARRNDEVMVKVEKARKMDNLGYTHDEIAKLFCVSGQTIKNWLSISELAPAVQKAIRTGSLAPTHAMRLAKLPKDEQESAAKEYVETVSAPSFKKAKPKKSNPLSVKRLRSWKQVEAMVEALGEDSKFIPVLKWVMGEDIDLTEL